METMCSSQILKKIHGNPDCAGEFILLNMEVSIEDKEFMLKDANRLFRLHNIGLKAVDVEFGKELRWQMEHA